MIVSSELVLGLHESSHRDGVFNYSSPPDRLFTDHYCRRIMVPADIYLSAFILTKILNKK